MLKHSALLAIAASATVGLTMLAPTDATARPGGGYGNHARVAHVGRIAGSHVHARVHNQRFFHNSRVFYNNRFFAYRTNFFRYNSRSAWHPGFCWRHPWYCRTQVGAYRYGVVPVIQPAPVIAAPVAPFGRCLRQIRLADGSSLFRNLCTNEAAITSNVPDGEPPVPLK